ncbi:MAG: hypothetical protein WBO24_11310 [Nitrospirales bacterium]
MGKSTTENLASRGWKLCPLDEYPAILVDNDSMATDSTFMPSIHGFYTLAITRLIAGILLSLDTIINHGQTLVDHIDVLHMHDPFDAVGAQYQYPPKLKTNRFHNSRKRHQNQSRLLQQILLPDYTEPHPTVWWGPNKIKDTWKLKTRQ